MNDVLIHQCRARVIVPGYDQDNDRVMQGSICVQHLHVVLDIIMPLHAQVNEAPGLHLLAFPVQNVMTSRLVLDSKDLRGGLMLLKDHMSSSRGDVKHLKHTCFLWSSREGPFDSATVRIVPTTHTALVFNFVRTDLSITAHFHTLSSDADTVGILV